MGVPHGPPAWRHTWPPIGHPQDPCPLCGLGELGSERIMLRCPAVSLAGSERAARAGAQGGTALARTSPGLQREVATFIHQVGVLTLVAQTRAFFQYRAAAAWLLHTMDPSQRGVKPEELVDCGLGEAPARGNKAQGCRLGMGA